MSIIWGGSLCASSGRVPVSIIWEGPVSIIREGPCVHLGRVPFVYLSSGKRPCLSARKGDTLTVTSAATLRAFIAAPTWRRHLPQGFCEAVKAFCLQPAWYQQAPGLVRKNPAEIPHGRFIGRFLECCCHPFPNKPASWGHADGASLFLKPNWRNRRRMGTQHDVLAPRRLCRQLALPPRACEGGSLATASRASLTQAGRDKTKGATGPGA